MSDANKVGIVGAGVMGNQIAALLAFHGYEVQHYSYDPSDDPSDKLRLLLRLYGRKYGSTPDQIDIALKKIHFTSRLEDVKDCFLVLETVIEDLPIKQQIFKSLDAICPPDTVIGSNTSSFP